jgi:ankyrin repeat protein
MTNKIYKVLLVVGVLISFSCGENKRADSDSNEDLQDLPDYDYRLFKATPVWNLAQAVEKQDSLEIKRIVREENVDVDYQEPKFGNTLLILSVINQQLISAETLLKVNADPNKHNTYDGSTALIEAAEITEGADDNTAFIMLLLAHGADPNQAETGDRKPGNTLRKSPLLSACSDLQGSSPIGKVKALVEAGANVNYEDEFNHFPLGQAVMNKQYAVVLYLLQKGANHEKMIIDRSKFQNNGKKLYIADVLREHLFPLGSEEHNAKMEVVTFLKTKNVDYRKTPIPDFVMKNAKEEYPGNWQEYLEKY